LRYCHAANHLGPATVAPKSRYLARIYLNSPLV
jgi:hypothetical protein